MSAHRLVVFGATSRIAEEISRLAARDGFEIFLLGRHLERLEQVAADLRVRGAPAVDCVLADLADVSNHEEVIRTVTQRFPDIDHVLVAYGSLTNTQRAEGCAEYAVAGIQTNFTSTVSLLTWLAPYFERRRKGCVTVLSSVAGERGRRSNYIYGAAKGGLTLFLQGYRSRLFSSGIRVLTVKPGMVDTPMTAHMSKTMLFSSPKAVAGRIYREMKSGSKDVLYVPGYWRFVVIVVRALPEWIAKRLSF
jgi:decaprenylphospho-beta-D-erythro-pentofuranosid-2-ulose 2-reductase